MTDHRYLKILKGSIQRYCAKNNVHLATGANYGFQIGRKNSELPQKN